MTTETQKPLSVGEGTVAGLLIGLLIGVVVGLALKGTILSGNKQRWREGFVIGAMAGNERSARDRGDKPLADWYRANRLLIPRYDWDHQWVEDYLNQK